MVLLSVYLVLLRLIVIFINIISISMLTLLLLLLLLLLLFPLLSCLVKGIFFSFLLFKSIKQILVAPLNVFKNCR